MPRKYISLALFGSASILALCAVAQTQETENVTVSASRISIAGYHAPTPVTVLDAATLNRDAKLEIGDSIRELPAVGISDSHNNGSRTFNASPGDAAWIRLAYAALAPPEPWFCLMGRRVVSSNPNNGANGGGGGHRQWRRRQAWI
jgi:hypothetical protein